MDGNAAESSTGYVWKAVANYQRRGSALVRAGRWTAETQCGFVRGQGSRFGAGIVEPSVMSEERWVVTHATESGATRMWWVDEDVHGWFEQIMKETEQAKTRVISFSTLTGRALIWLTPGQSLTVEKSNG